MPKENQDRDAIVTKAIRIASEEDRAAYIAQACDDNAELKRQVEERVAAHFQDDSRKESARREDTDKPSSEQAPKQSGGKLAKGREEVRTLVREHPRIMTVLAVLLLFLFIAAVGGVSLAVWEWREEKQARKAEQEAVEKQKKAEKEAEKTKGKLKRAVDEEKNRVKERDQAQEAERAAKRSEQEVKAILWFLKNKLLSAGRPGDVSLTEAFWAGTEGKKDAAVRKDMTLRQAVDETESRVAEAFADRPRAEASVREMLGLAYLNLGEAKEAVKQYERAYELREAIQGDNDPDTADCRNQLAVAYRLAGRDAEASRLYHRYPDSPTHASALAVRGSMLLSQKKPAEAELKLRECLTIRQKIQPDDWTTFDAKSLLGEALLDQKKYAEAEPLLLSGYEGMKQREAKIPSEDKVYLTRALERLVRLYEAWGKKDKAAKWRKELETSRRGPLQ
jgi:tetratricopeptide (TPR) repeat protein